jgi:hypothetical protein
MRALACAFLALALALPAGAALAQVQPNDPNAANASFALQSQIRTFNQQRVSDYNTLNQQFQRNVQFQPHGAPGRAQHERLHRLLTVTGPGIAGTARKKPFPVRTLGSEAGPMVARA